MQPYTYHSTCMCSRGALFRIGTNDLEENYNFQRPMKPDASNFVFVKQTRSVGIRRTHRHVPEVVCVVPMRGTHTTKTLYPAPGSPNNHTVRFASFSVAIAGTMVVRFAHVV